MYISLCTPVHACVCSCDPCGCLCKTEGKGIRRTHLFIVLTAFILREVTMWHHPSIFIRSFLFFVTFLLLTLRVDMYMRSVVLPQNRQTTANIILIQTISLFTPKLNGGRSIQASMWMGNSKKQAHWYFIPQMFTIVQMSMRDCSGKNTPSYRHQIPTYQFWWTFTNLPETDRHLERERETHLPSESTQIQFCTSLFLSMTLPVLNWQHSIYWQKSNACTAVVKSFMLSPPRKRVYGTHMLSITAQPTCACYICRVWCLYVLGLNK